MRRIATLVLSLCIAASVASVAMAGAPEGSWYVAPEIYSLWLDDERAADDDVGIGLAFGRTINANWDVELGIYGSQHDRANNGTLDLNGFALSGKRVFYRDGKVNPFINLGLGMFESRLDPGENAKDFSALYGVGLLIDLGGERADGSAMQLRGDLGARRALWGDSDSQLVDYYAGLGIQYNWGGTAVRKVVDSDGDGVADDLDRCPGTPAGTAVDTSGCPPDEDGDGVTNDNDKCPGTPAGARVDAVGCELDSDGDGVGDSRDQCPNTPAGTPVDEKGCPRDGDGDGIVDGVDQCPDTPKGERVDATGCPFKQEILLQGVKFATNSADLLPESIPVLDRAVATLKRYPELNIEVAGHTDDRGADAYNLQLSARRAESVLTYLKDHGVTNLLTSRGYGESEPLASNATADGRAQNRRVVLRALN